MNHNYKLTDFKLMSGEVDTQERELSLQVYIGFDIDKDCLHGKEIICSDDKDHLVIKNYYMTKLEHLVIEQIRKIKNCI